MSRTIWSRLACLTTLVASLIVASANVARFSFCATESETQQSFPQVPLFKTNDTDLTASPCARALTQRTVCVAANKRVIEILSAGHLEAITVVQDVRTGAVVAFAASHPSDLDVTTPVSPLSLSKLLLSASWWDNQQPDSSFDSTKGTENAQNPANRARVSVQEMLVGGSDSAGRQMALTLRKSVGTKTVIEDFKRYGLLPRTNLPRDDAFWGELATTWKARLVPATAYVSLSRETPDVEWAETLSIGETNMQVTALHVSRFLQAIGNNGMMLTPVARPIPFVNHEVACLAVGA